MDYPTEEPLYPDSPDDWYLDEGEPHEECPSCRVRAGYRIDSVFRCENCELEVEL